MSLSAFKGLQPPLTAFQRPSKEPLNSLETAGKIFLEVLQRPFKGPSKRLERSFRKTLQTESIVDPVLNLLFATRWLQDSGPLKPPFRISGAAKKYKLEGYLGQLSVPSCLLKIS